MNDKQKVLILIGFVTFAIIFMGVIGTFITLVWTLIKDMA